MSRKRPMKDVVTASSTEAIEDEIVPQPIRIIKQLLEEQHIIDYSPGVIGQLLDYTSTFITDIARHSRRISDYRNSCENTKNKNSNRSSNEEIINVAIQLRADQLEMNETNPSMKTKTLTSLKYNRHQQPIQSLVNMNHRLPSFTTLQLYPKFTLKDELEEKDSHVNIPLKTTTNIIPPTQKTSNTGNSNYGQSSAKDDEIFDAELNSES
ncbi:hypothetical protein SNEBB_003328 [Seison nebaliae]|nr:hypothetical protein SNEBB_003328 [Seison nebaliae]